MSSFLIGHAVINENNQIRDGYAGDQTGGELCAEKFFENGWLFLYRANDAVKAEQIADFIEKTVSNGYVGYSYENRHSLFNAVYPDFKVEELNEPAECDCASISYCAVYSAFRVPYKSSEEEKHIAPLVKGFEEYLMTGALAGNFQKLYYTSDTDVNITTSENLVRGDILIKDGHMAIWI